MSVFLSFVFGILSSIAAALLLQFFAGRLRLRFSFRRVMSDIRALYGKIRADEFVPDSIVTIDRNSAIVGAILSGFFTFNSIISIATRNERLPDGSRRITTDEARLPRPTALAGHNVLLLICFNDSGTSLDFVYSLLRSEFPQIKEIRTAALYSSASPKMRPRYCAWEVGRGLNASISRIINKMPWMSSEWHHIFASERIIDKH
jgi:hypoxanthine phosphoribosyltransferase